VTLPSAGDVLRHLLHTLPTVACLLPGTASVEEATENALAGHDSTESSEFAPHRIRAAVDHLRTTMCSRCGECEKLCSQGLPVSWLFRAASIERSGAVPFETPREMQYFDLHAADEQATCASCQDVTCKCPYGIDIPAQLIKAHDQMYTLLTRGKVPGPSPAPSSTNSAYAARLVSAAWNGQFAIVVVENVGTQGWHLAHGHSIVEVQLRNQKLLAACPMRADVGTGAFGYFAFAVHDGIEEKSCDLWIVFRHLGAETHAEFQLGQFLASTA
jgi:ferredoxin